MKFQMHIANELFKYFQLLYGFFTKYVELQWMLNPNFNSILQKRIFSKYIHFPSIIKLTVNVHTHCEMNSQKRSNTYWKHQNESQIRS